MRSEVSTDLPDFSSMFDVSTTIHLPNMALQDHATVGVIQIKYCTKVMLYVCVF